MNRFFNSNVRGFHPVSFIKIKRKLGESYGRLLKFYKLRILKEPFAIAISQWIKDDGDSTLRVDYPLTENSVILDIGGYMGEWAAKIISLYNPYVYIFEPVTEYYNQIVERFCSNGKVSVYNFGLSDKNTTEKLALLNDSSSVCRRADTYTPVVLKDIYSFIKGENIQNIDLMKINIEGGEYSLLKRMISTEMVKTCQDIQVQFHDFYPNAKQLREEIRCSLRETHFILYDYPFVWENWRKR